MGKVSCRRYRGIDGKKLGEIPFQSGLANLKQQRKQSLRGERTLKESLLPVCLVAFSYD